MIETNKEVVILRLFNDYELHDYLESETDVDYDPAKPKWIMLPYFNKFLEFKEQEILRLVDEELKQLKEKVMLYIKQTK